MIDVHIAHMPGERQDWWKECERSLEGQPVVIHHIDGVDGDVRQARLNGYSCGTHDYVAYVDPDDRVLPGAFAAIQAVLRESPDTAGAYSMSRRLNEAGEVTGMIHEFREYKRDYLRRHVGEIHQLAVMKRDVILRVMTENWEDIPPSGYAEITYYAMLAREYDWLAVDHVGYEWRVHEKGAHVYDRRARGASIARLQTISEDIINGTWR